MRGYQFVLKHDISHVGTSWYTNFCVHSGNSSAQMCLMFLLKSVTKISIYCIYAIPLVTSTVEIYRGSVACVRCKIECHLLVWWKDENVAAEFWTVLDYLLCRL